MPSPSKKPIERVPDLRSQVYERLRESVRSGELPAKGRFSEHSVARDYGVSRTPAREAIALLVRDGLLVQHGRGFRIPTHSIEDIFDVFEVRLCLEPQAMRHLSERLTTKQSRILRALLEGEFAEDRTLSDYASVQSKAREALLAMIDNKRLVEAIQLYQDHVHFVRTRTLVSGASQRVSRAHIRILLQALLGGDAEEAAAAMTKLLIAARDDIVNILKVEANRAGD